MDRPTRRSANGTASTATKDNANPAISSRRRRRDAESVASVSDGAETDSSSVGTEMGTRHAAATKATSTLPKGKRGGHNKAKLASPEKDQDNDDHHDGDDHDGEDPAKASASPATPVHETGGDDDNATGDAEDEDQAPSGYATRARRERSQSVVSTTSDTSSIASEVPEDPLRPELHGEKLQELEKKKKMVEDGTLAEFCRRVAEFKEERNRLLQTAEWHKNLQVKNTQDLYGFEVQRAHNIWKDNKDAVKVSMLSKADALLTQLKKELATLQEAGELPTHVVLEPRNLVPVKPAPPTDPTTQSAPQPIKRRKVSAPVPDNVLRLPLDDVTSDLAGILQEREAASTKIHAALAEPQLELSVDRRRLIVGKYVFEEGDEVVVTAVVLKQDYTGVISSVSDREIYVVLTSGQKVRVAVDHIAQRRCEIRPFLRGAAGIESLQTSGWVECEPF